MRDVLIDVFDVANYFIYKSNFDNKARRTISPLKLQKLIYYAQAWHVTLNEGKKMFDEDIEAWVHGPVVRSVYRKYRHYGYNFISEEIKQLPPKLNEKEYENIKETLDLVWKLYNELDAKTLEKMTHSEAPWRQARKGIPSHEASNRIITTQSMRDYYKKYLKDS